jgi:ABC-type dipeptide/oligopeptide/nickel transport system permease subunit
MKEDLRSLLYLISLGIVGAVTIGVFLAWVSWGSTIRAARSHLVQIRSYRHKL